MRMITRLCLILSMPFALSQCGGQGGQPLSATSAATVLGNLNTVLGQLPRSTAAPTLPMTGASLAASSVRGFAPTSCETVAPTTPVDMDSDQIALSKVSTFNCTSFTSGTDSLTRKGSYTVKDLDDTVFGIPGGLRVDFDVTKYGRIDTTNGDIYDNSYVGFWQYQQSGNTMVSTAEFNGHTFYTNSAQDYENDYDYTYTWNWTHTPDNIGAPFSTGSQDFSGSYKLDGRFMIDNASSGHTKVEGTWYVEYSTKDLKFDTVCTKWYRSGSIFIDDGSGGSFEIRYACATAELYHNGVKSDWWTP